MTGRTVRLLVLSLVLALWAPGAFAQETGTRPIPETGPAGPAEAATRFMIAAAHPLAAQAGHDVLAEGGSAIDAMVATQMVLTLVEPQSSGIGGGAFLVYYDADAGQVITLDGRETAPMAATPDLFLDEAGEPLPFWEAVVGGRSVGTPGTLRLMEAAHEQYGVLPWPRLLQPAIELAGDGFEVTPRLALSIRTAADRLRTYAAARDYFFPDGEPLSAGDVLRNPALAETLRLIAEEGSEPFYSGPIADDIVAAVQGAADNPGRLAAEDLAGYAVIARPPVCPNYRGFRVCGMGPPSSGGLTVGMILGLLEHADLATMGPESVTAWHLFAEAAKLAYADRARYMADSDFVPVPVAGLLEPTYLTVRAQEMAFDSAMATPAPAGNPPWHPVRRLAPDLTPDVPGTSHVAIVDADGNAVSLTTTIESAFGSTLMVRGFLLNNELTDFSFEPERDGRPVANRVEPGKRPRSSMAPTIVLDPGGGLFLVIGSPGGSRIITYVAQALIAVLDWRMGVAEAVGQPHVVNRNGPTELEPGAAWLAAPLTALGHEVTVRPLVSGLHGIQVLADGTYAGGADPRREGVVLGE
jgi:gamma-glutamyltranspeptidase/glutathione hydrolase